jgi:hypothetical protein
MKRLHLLYAAAISVIGSAALAAYATQQAAIFQIMGSGSGSVSLTVPAAAGSNTITLPAGTTDFSGTSGFIQQATTGAAFTAAAITAAQVPATPLVAGTGAALTGPREYYVCTGTCTPTPPVPVAGYEFCIYNDNNVATAITLQALGSSAMYENSARTAYGTAGTGTLALSAAAANKVCIVGRDATHYSTVSYNGTVTVN